MREESKIIIKKAEISLNRFYQGNETTGISVDYDICRLYRAHQ